MARSCCIPCGVILLVSSALATETQVLIESQSPVPPSTVQENRFLLKGVAQFSLTVNGVSLGVVRAPYTFQYTSKPLGQVNTFDASVCYYDGTLGTFNYTATSGGGATLRYGGSSLPRRR